MEQVFCGNCDKPITDKTEVEYSKWLTEYFCNHDCAINRYFDYMGSIPFQFEDHEMSENKVLLKNGKLFQKGSLE